MTIHVNSKEAEQKFSQLFSQVLQGEEIVIFSDGEEMARLIPSSKTSNRQDLAKSKMRVPGIDKGRFVVPENFDDPISSDIFAAYKGKA